VFARYLFPRRDRQFQRNKSESRGASPRQEDSMKAVVFHGIGGMRAIFAGAVR